MAATGRQGHLAGAGGTGPAGPAPGDSRSRLVAAIAERLGSTREARWLVDHAERAIRDSDHQSGVFGTSAGEPGEGAHSFDGRPLETMAQELADRRAAGEPLQYVMGRWPFRSLELVIDRRVLIPRPETEQVVEVALGELRRCCGLSNQGTEVDGLRTEDVTAPRVCVDLGTGSGAIALSLAAEGGGVSPDLEVWATDRAHDALQVAEENLLALAEVDQRAASRVRLAEGSWFDALPPELIGQVDLVVSNPPYVTESEYAQLDPTVREWEPRGALVAARGAGGVGGMAAIEAIIATAPRWLRPSGAVVIELAPHQAHASVEAARCAGFGHISTERDLAGRIRMLVARR